MARSTSNKKSGFTMNRNVMIVAFCVVAGTVVTACQPNIMPEKKLAPATSPEMMSSPTPSSVPVTETGAQMTPKSSVAPAAVNAQIDTSLKTFDSAVNDGDPKDLSGADLN